MGEVRNGEWRVNVREGDWQGPIVHTIWCASERDAERVERGIRINLNHSKYDTEIADHGDFAEATQ